MRFAIFSTAPESWRCLITIHTSDHWRSLKSCWRKALPKYTCKLSLCPGNLWHRLFIDILQYGMKFSSVTVTQAQTLSSTEYIRWPDGEFCKSRISRNYTPLHLPASMCPSTCLFLMQTQGTWTHWGEGSGVEKDPCSSTKYHVRQIKSALCISKKKGKKKDFKIIFKKNNQTFVHLSTQCSMEKYLNPFQSTFSSLKKPIWMVC